jgi:hypothetical protein
LTLPFQHPASHASGASGPLAAPAFGAAAAAGGLFTSPVVAHPATSATIANSAAQRALAACRRIRTNT